MAQEQKRRLISSSTREFRREARQVQSFSPLDWLHGYVYARWPYLYIGLGTGEHPLARSLRPVLKFLELMFTRRRGEGPGSSENTADRVTFADTYHGKVVPLNPATELVTIQEDITLTGLEQVIPYARARDVVLHNPDHIVALDCPCRSVRENPCLPLDVCLIVGEPFAGFVAEHHPERSHWITSDEAVEILQAEHERGHVHHAFFKDAMLGRFYAICNCCSCCCGAMQAQRNGVPMLASSGYVCQTDLTICVGCGACAESCQFGALSIEDGQIALHAMACMGCGVCVSQCPVGALSLVREPARGEPLEIRELLERATASA